MAIRYETITVNSIIENPQSALYSEPKKLEIPDSFVDETKDPQSYVDRYNNEANYKKWFDDNFSDSTIYDAVGIEKHRVVEKKIVSCSLRTN